MKPLEEKALAFPGAVVAELMQAVLEKGGLFRFCARGGSMTPFIRDGDTLTIAPLASMPPGLGEVVALSNPVENESKLVVHRVIGRQRTGFIVQGDGNGCTPEIISSENILGRLVKVERAGRHVRLGLGTERRLIAWLSRTRLLWRLVWPVWREFRQLFKRQNPSNGSVNAPLLRATHEKYPRRHIGYRTASHVGKAQTKEDAAILRP